MILEALCPLRVRFADADLHMEPGIPIELRDDRAERLLAKLPHKVRRLQQKPLIGPADMNANPLYWETGTGRILGPATPEFLAKDGDTFWIVTTFQGGTRWINAERLRSQQAFHRQASLNIIEIVKEAR